MRGRSLQGSDVDRTKCSFSSHSSVSRPHNVVADLHSAITTKQRVAVLKKLDKLLVERNEGNENLSLHDISHISIDGQSAHHLLSPTFALLAIDFVRDGILNALTLQLNTLIHRHGSNTTEIPLVCRCLALVFRQCSKEADFIGIVQEQGVVFLKLLTETLSHDPQQGVTESITIVLNVLTADAMGCAMVVSCKPIVLSLITMLCHNNKDLSTGSVVEILSTFKNLTYYVEEIRHSLIQQDTFLKGLARTSIRPDLSLKSKQRISSILRNLAATVECRTELAQQPLVIAILVRLTSRLPADTLTTSPDHDRLQRNLLDTMISLSLDQESSIVLILHGNGVLLNMLQRLLVDENPTIRRKAACSLRLLSHQHSAPLLIHNQELIHALSASALRDVSPAVKREASEAFARLGSLANATDHNGYYPAILDALTVLAQSAIRNEYGVSLSAEVLAMALKEQSLRRDNRGQIAIRTTLLLATAELAMVHDASLTSQYAATTLFNLSKDEFNLPLLLAQPRVMEAILHHATSYSMAQGNREGLLTVLHLARPPEHRAALARHPVLLTSLIDMVRRMPRNDPLRVPLVGAAEAIAQAL